MDSTPLFLQVVVGVFLALEAANVAALYLAPGSPRANAVGPFAGWHDSMADPDLHRFVRYLVYWVAGTKLIFLALWLVILLAAPVRTQVIASAVMVPAIATFYWRMYPIVRDLGRRGKVVPRGYARNLGLIIAAFAVAFGAAALLAVV